eukprot:1498453-Amphidinium_carterae.1
MKVKFNSAEHPHHVCCLVWKRVRQASSVPMTFVSISPACGLPCGPGLQSVAWHGVRRQNLRLPSVYLLQSVEQGYWQLAQELTTSPTS